MYPPQLLTPEIQRAHTTVLQLFRFFVRNDFFPNGYDDHSSIVFDLAAPVPSGGSAPSIARDVEQAQQPGATAVPLTALSSERLPSAAVPIDASDVDAGSSEVVATAAVLAADETLAAVLRQAAEQGTLPVE